MEEANKLDTYNTAMDSLITARGSTSGIGFTHLITVTSTSNQAYTIDNLDQYSALIAYIVYSSAYRANIVDMIIPIDMLKNSTSSTYIQPTYYDGGNGFRYGQLYYNTTNSIYAHVTNAYSMEIYGMK